MENKTLSLLLSKAGATALPEKIKQIENMVDSYASKLSNDMTKTPNQMRARVEIIDNYGNHLAGIITKIDFIRRPIANNVVW